MESSVNWKSPGKIEGRRRSEGLTKLGEVDEASGDGDALDRTTPSSAIPSPSRHYDGEYIGD